MRDIRMTKAAKAGNRLDMGLRAEDDVKDDWGGIGGTKSAMLQISLTMNKAKVRKQIE